MAAGVLWLTAELTVTQVEDLVSNEVLDEELVLRHGELLPEIIRQLGYFDDAVSFGVRILKLADA